MSKPTQAPPTGTRRKPKESLMNSSTETQAQTIIDEESWDARVVNGIVWK
jgi:hypothetical protein